MAIQGWIPPFYRCLGCPLLPEMISYLELGEKSSGAPPIGHWMSWPSSIEHRLNKMVELQGTQSTPRHCNQNVTSGDMKTSRPEKMKIKLKGDRGEVWNQEDRKEIRKYDVTAGMVASPCNYNMHKVEIGGPLRVQGHLRIPELEQENKTQSQS